MSKKLSRRQMLSRIGQAVALGALGIPACVSPGKKASPQECVGAVTGEEAGAKVGEQVLADGGNAIDAAVAAALVSCVATPARCGIAGYGGHMIIALAGGKKITSIDFNSTAPLAARAGMYPLDAKGEVKDRANFYGWRAVGVPGTLAGLQLALDLYGTRGFRELAQPAIAVAQNGFVVNPVFARTLRITAPRLQKDPASSKLYLPNGEPPNAGDTLRNPDLAALLSTLAERDSVESFYRGDIAVRIAEACQKDGGLLTVEDLAAYHAREIAPLEFMGTGFQIFTAPPTAGGITVLEAFSILKALNWSAHSSAPASLHAWLEALRLAWKDRLELLGDPEQVKVPVQRLLAAEYARDLAAEVRTAVKGKKPIAIQIQKHSEEGTNNLSSVDRHGNLVAITITQGGSFGAMVTVEGLGLTLGHGMSRFTPLPGHPNAPGPRKRPLHNMCPSVVLPQGRPVMAVGGAGGQRIPNALYEVLTQYVLAGASMEAAIAAPRLFCTGTLDVTVERRWPSAQAEYLSHLGFKVRTEAGEDSHMSAASFDPKTGECGTAMR